MYNENDTYQQPTIETRNFSKRKLIMTALVSLAILGTSFYLFYNKYKADTLSPSPYSGFVLDSMTNKALSAVKVIFSSNSDSTIAQVSAITDSTGKFTINLPSADYNQFTIVKDGYWDIKGTANLIQSFMTAPMPGASNTASNLFIPMNPGFGQKYVHLQTILPGDNLISSPLIPTADAPQVFLSYYTSQSSGATTTTTPPPVTPPAPPMPPITSTTPTTSPTTTSTAAKTLNADFLPNFLPVDQTLRTYDNATQKELIFNKTCPTCAGSFNKIDNTKAYWIKSNLTTPINVVMTGTPTTTGDIAIAKSGTALIGYPSTETQPISSVSITINGEPTTLKDALAKKTIAEVAYYDPAFKIFKIYNPTIELTARPGNAYRIKLAKDATTFSFATTPKDPDLVELPADVSLEAARWVSQTDPSTLDANTFPIWQYYTEKITAGTLAQFNSEPNPTKTPIGPITMTDRIIRHTKNGKTITENTTSPSTSQPLSFIPKALATDSSIPAGSPTLPPKSPPNPETNCVKLAVNYQLCAYENSETKKWDQASIDRFRDFLKKAYPNMTEIYGDPYVPNGMRTIKTYIIDPSKMSEGTAAYYTEGLDSITLSQESFTKSTWDDFTYETLVHENFHAFRFSKVIIGTGDDIGIVNRSWEEGQVVLATYQVIKKMNLKDCRKIDFYSEYYSLLNDPHFATSDYEEWISNRMGQYSWAAAAWRQIYDRDNSFLRKLNQFLYSNTGELWAIKKVTNNTVGTETFEQWYQKQWGLIQPASDKNLFIGINPINIRGDASSDEKIIINSLALAKISNTKGIIDETPAFSNRYAIYKNSTTNKSIEDNSASQFSNNLDSSMMLIESPLENHMYTFVNSSQYDNRHYPTVSFAAMSNTDSSIYGVVAEPDVATVTITPLKPAELAPQDFTISNGFFSAPKTDPRYGWNAGTYKINYTNACGRVRSYTINKAAGRYFHVLRQGKLGSMPVVSSAGSLLNNFAQYFNTQKASAASGTCYPDKLEIRNVKKEFDDKKITISFETTRPAFTKTYWGNKANDLSKNEPFSDPSLTHQVVLNYSEAFSGTGGDDYFYKIIAIDATGKTMPYERDQIPEEEDSDLAAFTTKSGSVKLFKITDVKSAPTDTKSTITWNTTTETIGKIEYFKVGSGSTAGATPGNTGWTAVLEDQSIFKLKHSVEVTGLVPQTKYLFRIKASSKDGCMNTTVICPTE